MREVVFLKNNQKKWRGIEQLMNSKSSATADQLAEVFIELTDDLAYAQTYYPDSKLTLYLNDLTAELYRYIYKNKKEKGRRIITFWTRELPLEFYKARKVALLAFSIFFACVIIGAVSSAQNPDFPRYILGDRYVDNTIDNIANGDPIAVYANQDEGIMFARIAWNNLRVSFLTFIFGIFLGAGTIFFLWHNGIMLGAFQYFFVAYGVFWQSFLGIWIHGIIEISCIIIAGTAGLLIGNSIFFPGTYKRSHSLQIGVKRGVKIFLGIIPLIILAAFLESFITNPREYELHWIARAVIIVASSAFVIWYFLLYPTELSKKMGHTKEDKEGHIVYGSIFCIIGGILITIIFFASEELNVNTDIVFFAVPLIAYGVYRILKGTRKPKSNEKMVFTN